MTRWLDPDEQRTWRAYMASTLLVLDQLDRQLQRDSRMPRAYYEILVRLSEAPGHRLRMSELADVSLSSRSRLSHAIARLERNGWVRREDCPNDKRGQFAVLTDAGFTVLERAAPGHVEQVRQLMFDGLTGEQAHMLREVSEALLVNLARQGLTTSDPFLTDLR